jgi:sec-independent protein translocase protein TatB
MNIFGIGELELVIVILIALVVAGPKRLIQWAYVAGKWVAKARKMWSEAMGLIQQELNASGVDVNLPKEMPTRASIRRGVESTFKPLVDPVKGAMDDVKSVGSEIQNTAKEAQQQVSGARTDLQRPPQPRAVIPTNGTKAADHEPDKNDSSFGTWSGS